MKKLLNMKIKTLGIVGNKNKPEVFQIVKDILSKIKRISKERSRPFPTKIILHNDFAQSADKRNKNVTIGDVKKADVILIFGGDGTLLYFARHLYPCAVPVFPINLGSLGFLAHTGPDEIITSLKSIFNSNFSILERMLLSIKIIKRTRTQGPFFALNDVVVTRGTFANVLNLDIHVGKNYTTTYQADGMIISTPTGSTAICLSAGGPIVHPKMEAFVMLPICPHTLSNRPLVLPTDEEISIQVKPSRHTEKNFILSIDGQEEYEINDGDKITITKADESMRVITLPQEDYFKILRTKLKWGGRNDF